MHSRLPLERCIAGTKAFSEPCGPTPLRANCSTPQRGGVWARPESVCTYRYPVRDSPTPRPDRFGCSDVASGLSGYPSRTRLDRRQRETAADAAHHSGSTMRPCVGEMPCRDSERQRLAATRGSAIHGRSLPLTLRHRLSSVRGEEVLPVQPHAPAQVDRGSVTGSARAER